MPTEVHAWRCDKCHRSYPTRERAVECEETCTQPVRYVHHEERGATPPISAKALRRAFKKIADAPLQPDRYQDSPAMRRALRIEEEE